jgi:ParB family chromosome partitioning protein
MVNQVQSITLDKLVAHPDNPNRMSRAKFAKLIRNIERTGRYEPLVVRPSPQKPECFQIINGHHRWRALKELGYKTADVVVWDIDDQDTDIMLATLNRLGGSDVLDKKLALLKRLNQSAFGGQASELAKLLPQTARQIKRLTELTISDCRKAVENRKSQILNPLVFFLNDKQQAVVAKALSAAMSKVEQHRTKAVKNAAALTYIAQDFLTSAKSTGKK